MICFVTLRFLFALFRNSKTFCSHQYYIHLHFRRTFRNCVFGACTNSDCLYQPVQSCSLIRIFAILLQNSLVFNNISTDREGPDLTAWIHGSIWTLAVHNRQNHLFFCCTEKIMTCSCIDIVRPWSSVLNRTIFGLFNMHNS